MESRNSKDALILILSRNAFYKRLHYYSLAALVLCLAMIASLSVVAYFLIKNPTRPIYFAADPVSRLIKIVPLNAPNMSTPEVMNWTIEAVQAAFGYDYINYRAQLQNAQKYFTRYGWQEYMKTLTASGNLLSISHRKIITIPRVIATPTILAEGILSGSYAWKFEFPLLVSYYEPPYDDKSKFSNALTVSVVVQRQDILQSYKGLGIVQLIATMGNTYKTPQELSDTSAS